MTGQLDEEFRQFMHGRWPAMVRLAYGLTGDLGHAEDVAQAAFAKAYTSWPRVIRAGNPDAYVRRILINENRTRFRRRRVRELSTGSPPETGVPDALRHVDDHSALLAALQALAPRQRAVVVQGGRLLRPRRDRQLGAGAAIRSAGTRTMRSKIIIGAGCASTRRARPATHSRRAGNPRERLRAVGPAAQRAGHRPLHAS